MYGMYYDMIKKEQANQPPWFKTLKYGAIVALTGGGLYIFYVTAWPLIKRLWKITEASNDAAGAALDTVNEAVGLPGRIFDAVSNWWRHCSVSYDPSLVKPATLVAAGKLPSGKTKNASDGLAQLIAAWSLVAADNRGRAITTWQDADDFLDDLGPDVAGVMNLAKAAALGADNKADEHSSDAFTKNLWLSVHTLAFMKSLIASCPSNTTVVTGDLPTQKDWNDAALSVQPMADAIWNRMFGFYDPNPGADPWGGTSPFHFGI